MINGAIDKLIPINGASSDGSNHPPTRFAHRFFREKYNCDPNNVK